MNDDKIKEAASNVKVSKHCSTIYKSNHEVLLLISIHLMCWQLFRHLMLKLMWTKQLER